MDFIDRIEEKEAALAEVRGRIAALKHELRNAYKQENELQGGLKTLKQLRKEYEG